VGRASSPGYQVELVAKDLTYPTSIAFDGSGGLYVAEAGYAYGDPIAPAQIVRIGAGGSRASVGVPAARTDHRHPVASRVPTSKNIRSRRRGAVAAL
jgi:hypothetical protein